MIKVEKIVKTCNACPAQWEGITDDNRQIYVRYRWGNLSICVGDIDAMGKFDGVRGDEVLFIDHGDEFDGVLNYAELKELSAAVVEIPECEGGGGPDWQINICERTGKSAVECMCSAYLPV